VTWPHVTAESQLAHQLGSTMRYYFSVPLSLCLALANWANGLLAQSPDYPIQPVPAKNVQFTDAFWRPRLEINRTVTIPYSFQMCESTGRIENFKVAAGRSDKKWVGKFGFNDSDVSKIAEGASYSLMTEPDSKLAAYLEDLISDMAAAQEPDGYLETVWTARDRIAALGQTSCRPKTVKWLGEADSHELYNVGHMYEAAAAHYEATGNPSFLDVAKKSADLLVDTFGTGKIELPPGHPEVELGLVKLYRATGDRRYLDLAKFFIDIRGTPTNDRPKLWGQYNQDHKPLRDQDEAVGHAVRAAYLYAGATDIAALTGDESLAAAVDRLWDNVVGKKQYLTGGIGSKSQVEAFGRNYELPNRTAYCETCAAIADCLWAHRMFLLHGDAKYVDVLERTLYNNALAGVSLDGKQFFYANPLESRGNNARSTWFDCSCCPTNICRFIPSVPGYVYAVRNDALYVNLFVEGTTEIALPSGKVRVDQKTRYPWDGQVEIAVQPQAVGQKFALHVRLPGWAQSEVFPSDLYHYLDKSSEQPKLAVNGTAVEIKLDHGYAIVDRLWQSGDTVTLELPMRVRRVAANDAVEADRGRVALVRGPIVYAVEWPDVPDSKVLDLILPDEAPLAADFRADLLGGVQVISGEAQRAEKSGQPTDVMGEAANSPNRAVEPAVANPVHFSAIPYYAWAHRGKGEMAVWLPRTPDKVGDGAQPSSEQAKP
jgi:DUF1680 family protein